MPEIPLTAVDRLIRLAGAERVSERASKKLRSIIEGIAVEIAKKGIELNRHSGKKTMTGDEITLAYQMIFSSRY